MILSSEPTEMCWRVELLGGLRARRGDQVILHFRTRKMADLLAYLAYFRQRSHPRELLIDLLWPEADPDAGRHNLSMALSLLRQVLEPPGMPAGSVLITDRHCVRLSPTMVTTDVAEFEAALKSSERSAPPELATLLAAAAESYGGELLPGHYDDWVFPEQQRLEEMYFHTLRQLISSLEESGDHARALQYAIRMVSADRLREEAHREVIRLYAATGRPDAAMRQYRELERILKEELDARPDAETRAIVDSLSIPAEGEQTAEVSPATLVGGGITRRAEQARSRRPEPIPAPRSEQLEPVGGAVPLGSRFYVVRPTDQEFLDAIDRQDSIVLVKGARQVGKTSLLARGLLQARESGRHVVLTHFQTFSASDFRSSDSLLFALAESLTDQLDLSSPPAVAWDTRRSPNMNFRRHMQRVVLANVSTPLVWGMDEVDRLFSCSYGSEIFGLFRSWHDERALDPGGPWGSLTLAIAYSTEAHLFITDVNQSPFNVGTRLALDDFTRDQVGDLNGRYNYPIKDDKGLGRYYGLVGGHPYLVRRGLHEMAAHGTPLSVLESRAGSDEWIFGEHLRRITVVLARDSQLCDAARSVLDGRPCPTDQAFYRLRSAGVLVGESAAEARPRCRLYALYLHRTLG